MVEAMAMKTFNSIGLNLSNVYIWKSNYKESPTIEFNDNAYVKERERKKKSGSKRVNLPVLCGSCHYITTMPHWRRQSRSPSDSELDVGECASPRLGGSSAQ